jgi:phosphoribosylaminoimidazolecarboxamide formyltransferase / IMP cyclohydrolase
MPMDFKLRLATRVFTTISNYDLEISRYLSNLSHESSSWTVDRGDNYQLGGTVGRILVKQQELRYGENPHQKAALYRDIGSKNSAWEQLGGKELSYNNLLDFDAALRLISAFKDASPTVAIIKHSNPCGVASAEELPEALRKSKLCDPRSHFGGIIACNRTVCSKTAAEVAEDFAEIILAPGFEADALQVLQKKKNLRIIKAPLGENLGYEFRSVVDGVLIQEPDTDISRAAQAEVVSARKPDSALLEDLQFAWTICAHVKSNAIVIVRDRMMVGSGTGQMSRIDSVELAIHKARTHGHNLRGSVAASDAFFPFPDSVMTLSDAGVTAIIAPAGSKKDTETIEAANRNAQVLLFARDRHFRH